MKAECYTLSGMTPTAVWAQDFMSKAGHAKYVSPGTLHAVRRGGTSSGRTCHTHTRKLLTKEHAESGKLKLDINTDTLTKPLQGALLERLRDLTLGYTT